MIRVDPDAIGRATRLAQGRSPSPLTANVSDLLATRDGPLSLVAVMTSMWPASTVVLTTELDCGRLTRRQAIGLGLAVVAVGTSPPAREAERQSRHQW